jgi:hypothetical protein
MPTKTDRILSYLPGTFRALPKPTALYAFADAFGGELQGAENSLAALMMAHWVDHADRGEELIADLACLAALYGLAPRGAAPVPEGAVCPPLPADETVEEFREHLKRYVRTFLQGTVTVQGILRVVAEALGLHITDEYADMDTWWTRYDDALVTTTRRGDDAAELLFGAEWIEAAGQPDRPAQVVGPEFPGGEVDLAGAQALRLKVDGTAAVPIDLPAHATLPEIVAAINNQVTGVARLEGSRLVLASPQAGPGSQLEVQEVTGDAAPRLLGLLPHTYRGAAATPAQVTGRVDLADPIDMDGNRPRYLRLRIDDSLLAEIDCADPDSPAATHPNSIPDRINDQLKEIDARFGQVASLDGQRLALTSPTAGGRSSIAFEVPGAQDATERLFSPLSRFYGGSDPLPAQAVGGSDLSGGVDLSTRSSVRLQVDDGPPVTVDCAGEDPARTRPAEIAAALNAALGPGVASQDGRIVRLASLKAGPEALLAFEPLPEGEDAADLIFGIGPRTFQGAAATQATIVGAPDLSQGVNLWARHTVQVAVDGGPMVEVDARAKAEEPAAATLEQIACAVQDALGDGTASHDGQHLILRSPAAGAASSLAIEPLQVTHRRRFVTRAFVTDEAAQAILGFVHRQADGTPATPARLAGTVDLSRGVDLREARFLRFSLDGRPAQEVDLATSELIPRPRLALLSEDNGTKGIVAAINQVWPGVASHDGQHLILASSQASGGCIAFEPPRGADALDRLLGLEPGTFRGRAASGVRFRGTVDLSAGVDLPAQAAIAVGVDDGPVVDVALTGDEPAHKSLGELAVAINVKLGDIFAQAEGVYLGLASKPNGADSRVEFAVPVEGADVTEELFGIEPPRCYRGAAAEPAEAIGARDLPPKVDLRVARTLRMAMDGVQHDVDCAADQADLEQVAVDDVVKAVNDRFEAPVARYEGGRLILRSPTSGGASRLDLLAYGGGDARPALLGDVPDVSQGDAPKPAVIKGEVDLLAPVNLGERRLLRLAVDGGHPVDVDVAGAAPETTMLEEIVAKINAVWPKLASATDDDRLYLRSPTSGVGSQLEVVPLRHLEMIEYSPEPAADPPEDQPAREVRHGDCWTVLNDGAAESCLEVEIEAPHGVAGPELVNRTTGWRIRLMTLVQPGETARIWRDPPAKPCAEAELRAEIEAADGTRRSILASDILARSLSLHARDEEDLIHWQADALILPQGRSQWVFLDCHSARFNQDRFGEAHFAGGPCRERGVFDVSRFLEAPPGREAAIFAGPVADPPVKLRFRWQRYQPGAFVVNLPLDLPERFGARFNQARFGRAGKPEEYQGVVAEARPGVKPEDDPDHLVHRVLFGREKEPPSTLIQASWVDRVPIGYTAAAIPFRGPRVRKLGGGSDTEPARLYLHDPEVAGFVELCAREPGAWGNGIAVTVRKSGPARYDVTIGFAGARFENARQVALAGRILGPDEEPLPALAQDLFKPGPVGVLQAKAAGVQAGVTRE